MKTTLSFTETMRYKDDPAGIVIPVTLTSDYKEVLEQAKVDPGAEVCLFKNEVGRQLGLIVERGKPATLGTLTGSIEAFGHWVTLRTGDLVFESLVYFAKYPNLPRNILGRIGWSRNLRLGIVDSDNLLYLGPNDDDDY